MWVTYGNCLQFELIHGSLQNLRLLCVMCSVDQRRPPTREAHWVGSFVAQFQCQPTLQVVRSWRLPNSAFFLRGKAETEESEASEETSKFFQLGLSKVERFMLSKPWIPRQASFFSRRIAILRRSSTKPPTFAPLLGLYIAHISLTHSDWGHSKLVQHSWCVFDSNHTYHTWQF